MKTSTSSVTPVLSKQLQKLLFIEQNMRSRYLICRTPPDSFLLKVEMDKYLSCCNENALRLAQVLSYLRIEPEKLQSDVFREMIKEAYKTMKAVKSYQLIDVIFVGCIESIITYKISVYRSAYAHALELGLEAIADLLLDCLETEESSRKPFALLGISAIQKPSIVESF